MTLAEADTYIANIMGLSDAGSKLQARDALKAAMERLTRRHDWSFLLQDTSQTQTILCLANNSTTVTTAVTDGFIERLVGQTVTGTDIPDDTTIVSIDSSDYKTMVISNASTADITAGSLVFGGEIPLIQGVQDYLLPTKFFKPLSCRVITNNNKALDWIFQHQVDKITYDQTLQGTPSNYTIYNGTSDFDASSLQRATLRIFRVPNQSETVLLRYYRPFDVTKDPVDIPEEYLFMLLDFASALFIKRKNAMDPRIGAIYTDALRDVALAVDSDLKEGGEDEMEGMKPPQDFRRGGGPPFYPSGDHWGYGGF